AGAGRSGLVPLHVRLLHGVVRREAGTQTGFLRCLVIASLGILPREFKPSSGVADKCREVAPVAGDFAFRGHAAFSLLARSISSTESRSRFHAFRRSEAIIFRGAFGRYCRLVWC